MVKHAKEHKFVFDRQLVNALQEYICQREIVKKYIDMMRIKFMD